MFEKEAKEYGDNYVKSKYMETVDETWKNGAMFGYNKANERITELELKIKKLTQHLEPQKMTSLFEQVEEEVRQGQRLNELEKENAELKAKKIPQLERKIASIHRAHSVDCKKLNARIEQCERQKKQIFALEKFIKTQKE